jgi:hypothetical protein
MIFISIVCTGFMISGVLLTDKLYAFRSNEPRFLCSVSIEEICFDTSRLPRNVKVSLEAKPIDHGVSYDLQIMSGSAPVARVRVDRYVGLMPDSAVTASCDLSTGQCADGRRIVRVTVGSWLTPVNVHYVAQGLNSSTNPSQLSICAQSRIGLKRCFPLSGA